MSWDLRLAPGRVVISRDIIVDGSRVGIVSHFERSNRLWVEVALDDGHEGHGYEAATMRLVIDRFTEMKIPVISVFIDYDNDYLGGILNSLGFNVFQVSGGFSLLEKRLLP